MKSFRNWRLHYALRQLRLPGFSQLLPEYQYSVFLGLLTTFLFYHLVESPWYMNLVVLWFSMQVVLGIIILSVACQKQQGDGADASRT